MYFNPILTHLCWVKKNDNRWSYLQSRNRDTAVKTEYVDTKRDGGWDELGDWDWHIYAIDTMY